MKIIFKGWKCVTEVGHYENGRKALTLLMESSYEPVATASVNLVDVELTSNNHMFIKSYSENSGLADDLIEYGIIERDITSSFWNGFVIINEYKLTSKVLKEWKKVKS